MSFIATLNPTVEELFDVAPVGLLVCQALREPGPDGRIIDFQGTRVNQAATRLLGIPREVFLTRPFLETQPGARESGLFDRYVAVVETGASFTTEVLLDGHWYTGSAVPVGDGFLVSFVNVDPTQAALQREMEARSLLQGVLDASPWAVVYLEPVLGAEGEVLDFVFRMANAASVRIGKRPVADLLGQRVLDLYPHTRTSGLFDRYVNVWKTGESFETELAYVAAAEGIDAWSRIQAVRQAGGLVITTVDITESKLGQRIAQQQSELVRNLLDGSLTQVAAYEAVRDAAGDVIDLRYIAVNQQTERATGRSSAELIGQKLCELFPTVRTSGLFDRWKAIVTTGQPDRFEWHYQRDGYEGWFDCSGVRHGDGLIQTYYDITDRKLAELELVRQADSLQAILDGIPASLFISEAVRDADGAVLDFRIVGANARSLASQDRTQTEVIGQLASHLFPQDRTNGIFERYCQVITSGEMQRFEWFFEQNGYASWVEVRLVPFGTDRVIASSIDITSLKQAELDKQQQAEFLQSVLDSAQTGIVLFDILRDEAGRAVDFRYRLSNVANATVLGLPNEALLGRTIQQVFPAIIPSDFFHRLRHVAETGEPQRFEQHSTLGGQERWGDASLVRLGDRILFTFLDVSTLKRAQLVQQRQAEILDGVLNNTPSGIIHWEAVRDEAGLLVDFRANLFNRAAAETGGFRKSDLDSRTLRELSPEGLFEQYRDVLETGRPLRVEEYFQEVNGWFDLTAAQLGDGLVVCFNDISLVRQNTLERQRHAETLEALLDGAINGIWALEAHRNSQGEVEDFIITAANRAAADILGRPLHELVGVPLLRAYPNNKQMGYFQHYVEAIETGLPQRFISRYHADGLDSWFDVSAVRQNSNRLVVTFVDVSDAKRAQQALIGESVLFQTLSSQVPETGVLVVNTRGRIVFANGELPALFLPSASGNLAERRLSDVLLPEYRSELRDALGQALNGRPSQISTEIGEAFYELYYGPVKNTEAQVVMAMVTFRNVTRDRLYQQQLKASNENLERFAYVASHDLQEPLRKIQAFGDMLYRKQAGQLDADSVGYIQRMQNAAQRMNSLIGDLLAYSRVSSTPPTFETVTLPAVVRAVRSDLDLVIHEKKATLLIDPLPTVVGDATQFRQLFQNLISNALKFSRPGVPPVIELRYRTLTGTHLPADTGLSGRGTYHEICVTDNGIGFDTEYADRIFEAFQRLHGRSEYPGTGIGLAIVRKVVENHRGTILVESTPGQGSAFRVLLPSER